jgi:hypothetical protein
LASPLPDFSVPIAKNSFSAFGGYFLCIVMQRLCQ